MSEYGTLADKIRLLLYRCRLPRRVRRIRRKARIRVLFVVSEAAAWKSEELYLAMREHPRFEPLLGVSTSSTPPGQKETLLCYLRSRQYPFTDLDAEAGGIDAIAPDIIFYYKPYPTCYSEGHFFSDNKRYVFCGMDYCFSVTSHAIHIEKEYFDYCWRFFTEHADVAVRRRELLGWRARNTRVTGVPMQDILFQPRERFPDPWKDRSGKKRIIYAPHHSFPGSNGDGLEFATFLDFGEPMLAFARKYQDAITIAFKPHPQLYTRLLPIWGQEKTDAYYRAWAELPNTQVETGEYVGLFKYSDAIIHDCASFIIEYLYMDRPSLFLVAPTNDVSDMFPFVQAGFRCYEHATDAEAVEGFIRRLIAGGPDPMAAPRGECIRTNLLPPGGRTACENILENILNGK